MESKQDLVSRIEAWIGDANSNKLVRFTWNWQLDDIEGAFKPPPSGNRSWKVA